MEEALKHNKLEQSYGVEVDAQNAPVRDIGWHATKAETEAVPIIDPGAGKEFIVRHFFIKKQPSKHKWTKRSIIEHYKLAIEASLWGDGLMVTEDKPLELHTLKSARKFKSLYAKMLEEGADHVILVPCEPRRLQTVTDLMHIAK